MDIGYARVSTAKQDLTRQLDALAAAGIAPELTHVNKKSGATRTRPGVTKALQQIRPGDMLVVHTLDRLGRTVRDTLNLVHELTDKGVGLRTLADPFRIDTTAKDDPMNQLALFVLALFGQMERTYAAERSAHARAVATANGRRAGRPTVADPDRLNHETLLPATGATIAEKPAKTGISRSTLYRHLSLSKDVLP